MIRKRKEVWAQNVPILKEKQIFLANERQARETCTWSEGSGVASVFVHFLHGCLHHDYYSLFHFVVQCPGSSIESALGYHFRGLGSIP